jgi:hypothetical protein
MTLNQNPQSTKRFAVIGYTGSKRQFKKIKSNLLFSNAVWNYNREREKSKYLDNISVLPTSIFIFDKSVDGTQPEVAGEIAGTFWEPCLPCVQIIDCWQFSNGTFLFTLTSFRCTGNSLLWRAIGVNMLDCCGGLFISDIFKPNKRIFYYFNSE